MLAENPTIASFSEFICWPKRVSHVMPATYYFLIIFEHVLPPLSSEYLHHNAHENAVYGGHLFMKIKATRRKSDQVNT